MGIYTVHVASNVTMKVNYLRPKYLCPSLRGQYKDIGSKSLKAFDSQCETAIQFKCLLSLNSPILGSIIIFVIFILCSFLLKNHVFGIEHVLHLLAIYIFVNCTLMYFSVNLYGTFCHLGCQYFPPPVPCFDILFMAFLKCRYL